MNLKIGMNKIYKEEQGEYMKKRSKHKVICKNCNKEFLANSGNRKFCNIKCFSKYHNLDLKTTIARRVIVDGVANGTIKRNFNCKECGKETITHAHHKNYNFPLLVEWLCLDCHLKKHSKSISKNLEKARLARKMNILKKE